MWGVGRLRVHGICSLILVYKDVVVRTLTCGDLVIPLVVIRLGVTGLKNAGSVDVFST